MIPAARLLFRVAALAAAVVANGYTGSSDWPYPPSTGKPSTAVAKNDPSIVAWATGYEDLFFGGNVSTRWQNPVEALGPAEGTVFDILCLGRGGRVTLTFQNPVTDGPGADFCVFENSFSASFLELAWVEVSSDGVHFVRFPNYSYTPASGGGSINPRDLFGLAGKYPQGQGTPFDLAELVSAHAAALSGENDFTPGYEQHLELNFPHLDVSAVSHIRIVDIVGDGTALSSWRSPIDGQPLPVYDPFPTTGSAGFDLDAVGVIHALDPGGSAQVIDFPQPMNQRLGDGSLGLFASASSGLPVSFEVLDGPAVVSGNVLQFAGKGPVVVRAYQPGNATFAPAVPVVRSLVIADELQRLFVEPLPNQLTGAAGVPIRVHSSSGRPVLIDVVSGPPAVSPGFHPNYLLSTGPDTGEVRLRAIQLADEDYAFAPSEPQELLFEIVDSGQPGAPLSFAEWSVLTGLSGSPGADFDGDGSADIEEFVRLTDPKDRASFPAAQTGLVETPASGDRLLRVSIVLNRQARVRTEVRASDGLALWQPALPRAISSSGGSSGGYDVLDLALEFPVDDAGFVRFRYTED